MGSGTHILPGIERGAQAGIEPATGAWVTQRIGSAASGTDHVHTPAPWCDTKPHMRPDATFPASYSNRVTWEYRRG